LWWVSYVFAEEQYEASGRPELREALDWLDMNYTLAETHQFDDLEVTLFTDPQIEDATCSVS